METKYGLDDFVVTFGKKLLLERLNNPLFVLQSLESDSEPTHIEKLPQKTDFPEMIGFMKDIQDYILKTSPLKQPILVYGSVIAILGTILSGLYRFFNSHPVFYVMFVARSGTGKDRPLTAPQVLFSDENLQNYIGFGGYRSDASIIDTLPDQRIRLDVIDEVDQVLKISKGDNGFQAAIVNVLTELWSAPSKLYPGRRTKKDGVFGKCWNPCVNIISALTPTAFMENFTKSMMQTGFGGRFMYFISEEHEYTENFVGTEMDSPPEKILKALRHWHNLKLEQYDHENKRYNIQSLLISDEARKRLNELRKHYHNKAQRLDEDSPLSPIAQRTYEYLERLLVVQTCSVDPFKPSPIIQIENVEWCRQFMDALFEHNKDFILSKVTSSKFALLKAKILDPIKRAREKGIPHSRLLKNSHLRAKELSEIIQTLEESGQILSQQIKGKRVYFYIEK